MDSNPDKFPFSEHLIAAYEVKRTAAGSTHADFIRIGKYRRGFSTAWFVLTGEFHVWSPHQATLSLVSRVSYFQWWKLRCLVWLARLWAAPGDEGYDGGWLTLTGYLRGGTPSFVLARWCPRRPKHWALLRVEEALQRLRDRAVGAGHTSAAAAHNPAVAPWLFPEPRIEYHRGWRLEQVVRAGNAQDRWKVFHGKYDYGVLSEQEGLPAARAYVDTAIEGEAKE